jgi:membrane peptidoglycan carboxypeptidase
MAYTTGSRRTDLRPLNDRPVFKPVALLLLVPVILLAAGLVAVVIAPPFVGAAFGVKRIDAKITALGANFTRIPRPPERSTIYASDGKTVLAYAYLENREYVRLQDVSPIAQKTVLAIEDSDFYHHGALSISSLFRAIVADIKAGSSVQGASTITEQLVKTALGTDSKGVTTFQQKLQEFSLAVRVEKKYSKNKILELYLNDIYLSNGVYGIGTAAEYYFGIPASKLTLTQGATLAGLIRDPGYYDPIHHPQRARVRRNDVLNRMIGSHVLKWKAGQQAKRQPLGLAKNAGVIRQEKPPYFVTYLENQILDNPNGEFDELGKTVQARKHSLYEGGLRIVTTFNPTWQSYAQQAANQPYAVPLYHPAGEPAPDTSIVSEDVSTGAIRTLLSGRDFARDQLNLADTPHAPGSSFKPYVLTAAFEEGIPPTQTYSSKSPYFPPGGWPGSACNCVENAEGPGNEGMIDLYTATTQSVNVVFAQLIQDVGPQNVVNVAHEMGVTSDLPAVNALATGSVGITPLDQASGYQTLANGGLHCIPYTVESISTDTQTFYRHKPQCTQAVPPDIAHLVTTMLESVVTSGTGTAAALYPWTVAGKTGTADGNTNVWFVGYTAQVVTAVWVGSPGTYYSLGDVFGGTVSAPIWHNYMARVMQGLPAEPFPYAPMPSLGPPQGNVPNVVGMDQATATQTLQSAGLVAAVQQIPSSQPVGTVVSQSPAAGSSVATGSTVTLQVSNGQAPASGVPNVVGMSQAAAGSSLSAAGFNAAVVQRVVTNPSQYGVVVSQSPAAGTQATQGSTVTITVGSRA